MEFPNRPGCTTEELRQDVVDLVPELERRISQDVTIGTASTPVIHGLGKAPRMVVVLPHADARVWRADLSDNERVYLAASASVVCDLEFIA